MAASEQTDCEARVETGGSGIFPHGRRQQARQERGGRSICPAEAPASDFGPGAGGEARTSVYEVLLGPRNFGWGGMAVPPFLSRVHLTDDDSALNT